MRSFDYSFLDNGLLPVQITNMTGSVYALKTMAGVRKEAYGKIFTALERVAKIRSIQSSNEIEGIVTTQERLSLLAAGSSAPLNHNEAEIAGYRDALRLVHENHGSLDFCERDILQLHRTLMGYVGDGDGGRYKQNDNYILETAADGRRSIRFYPTSALETPAAMEQLCLAYLDARDNAQINQLLLIPCVILDFLCIHPFRDGNGRMSRLLSLLLLYRNGFDAGKYISFEEQINRYKANYYESLRQSSKGWQERENDYSPFIQNFISTLYLCYKELDARFASVQARHVSKQSRIEATLFNSLTPLSKSELCEILPDISASTVEAVLGRLVRDGLIQKLGAGRNTRYRRV